MAARFRGQCPCFVSDAFCGLKQSIAELLGNVAGRRRATRRRSVSGRTPAQLVRAEHLEDRCLLSAGQLDPTFGSDGLVVTNVADQVAYFHGADMTVQPDGRIVVVGTADSTTRNVSYEPELFAADSNNRDIFVMRWLPNGMDTNGSPLDPTFGDNGIVRITVGFGYEAAGAVHLLPDGKILVAGICDDLVESGRLTSVWRLNPDGSFDDSFGDGGRTTVAAEMKVVSDLVVTASGRIIVAGYGQTNSYNDIRLCAFDANGMTDLSYGVNGLVVTDFLSSNGRSRHDRPARAVLLSDEKLLVIGPSIASSDGTIAVRYNPDGSLDTSFATGGKFLREGPTMYDVVVLPDGRYLLGGENVSPALMMLLPDGTPDTSFAPSGYKTIPVPVVADVYSLRDSAIHRLRVLPTGQIQAVIVRGDGYGDYWQPPSTDYPMANGYRDRGILQLNPDGSPDTTFSGDGWLPLTGLLGGYRGPETGIVYGDIWQPDGKVVLMSGEGGSDVVRLMADFSPDPTFAAYTGRGLVRLPSSDEAHGVTIMPDGKILVTGRSRGIDPNVGDPFNSYPWTGGPLALRYDATGQLDSSFDGVIDNRFRGANQFADGRIVVGTNSGSSSGEGGYFGDTLLLNDGSVFAPMVFYRRTILDGQIINAYGEVQDGWSYYLSSKTSVARIGGIVQLADGRIVVAGRGQDYWTAVEDAGVVSVLRDRGDYPVPYFTQEDRWVMLHHFPIAMQLTPEEDLVIISTDGIRKYDLSGNLLLTFDVAQLPAGYVLKDVAVQPDGGVVVIGNAVFDGIDRGFVGRFLSEGVPDSAFGTAGTVVLPSVAESVTGAVEVDGSGRIVVWGSVGNSVAAFRLLQDGTADTQFGNHGVTRVVAAADAWQHVGTEFSIQPDGAIVGVGYVTQFDGREDVIMVRLLGDDLPATPAVTHISPDTGRHDHDAVTMSSNLMIYGTARADSPVTVYLDDASIGTVMSSADGTWAFDYSQTALPEGHYEFTAKVRSGLLDSHHSAPLTVTIDRTPPAPSVPEFRESGGLSPYGDHVTVGVEEFSGTAEPEAAVYLYQDGVAMTRSHSPELPLAATAFALSSTPGSWKVNAFLETETLRFTGPGIHRFATQVEDLAGNFSVLSDPVTVWFVHNDSPDRPGLPVVTMSGGGAFAEGGFPELLFETDQTGLIASWRMDMGGTAVRGEDYVGLDSVSLEGNRQHSVAVVTDDGLYEPDETIILTQSSPQYSPVRIAPETTTLTILNDDAPSVSAVPDLITRMDQPLADIFVSIGNYGAGVEVPVVLESDNSNLFPDGSLVVTGTGAERRLTLTPAAGQIGTATITLSAGHGLGMATEAFTVAVADAAQDVHEIASIPDQVTSEDSFLALDIHLLAAVPDDLHLNAWSADSTLLPASGIQFTGTGADRQLILAPAADRFGSTFVTVSAVNSAGQAVVRTFLLTVSEVNDPLTITTATLDVSVIEDSVLDLATLSEPLFVVSDLDTDSLAVLLTVSGGRVAMGSSFGQAYLYRFSQPDGDRARMTGTAAAINQTLSHLQITPLADRNESVELKLRVNDAGRTNYGYASEVIDVSVSSGTAAYALDLPGEFMNSTYAWSLGKSVTGLQWLTLGFADPVYSTGAVITEYHSGGFVRSVEAMNAAGEFVSVWSGTDPLSAAGDLVLSWPETNFLVEGLRITVDADHDPAADQGIDAVRLIGTNPTGPFLVETQKFIAVTAVEDLPSLPSPRTLNAQTGVSVQIPFPISDPETPLDDLDIVFTSGDEGLLPASGITYDRTTSTPRLVLTGSAGNTGTTTLTVTVTDGAGNIVRADYPVKVNFPKRWPIIVGPSDVTTNEDEPVTFTVTVSDEYTDDPSELVVSAMVDLYYSGIKSGSVQVTGSGAERTVTYLPPPEESGYVNLKVIVKDRDGLSASISVRVDVVNQDDAPQLTGTGPRHTPVDTALVLGAGPAGPMTVVDPDSKLVQFTVTSDHGSLEVGNPSRALMLEDGTVSGTWSFLADHAAAGELLSGLIYHPDSGYSGGGAVTVTAEDRDFPPSSPGTWPTSVIRTVSGVSFNRPYLTGGPGTYDRTLFGSQPTVFDVRFSVATDTQGLTILTAAGDAAELTDLLESVELKSSSGSVLAVIQSQAILLADSSRLLIPWDQVSGVQSVRLTFSGTPVNRILDLDGFQLHGAVAYQVSGSSPSVTNVSVTVSTPPTLQPLGDVQMTEDTASDAISLVITDAETIDPPVIVTSDHPELFSEFVVSGSGAGRQLVLVPAGNQFGSAVVTVTVDDGAFAVSQTFAATVLPENDRPEGVAISNSLVSESADNSVSAVEVGQLLPIDVDSSGHAFVLVAGDGDDDNARFEIQGDRLLVRSGVVLDYELQPEYSVRIQVTDSEGLSAEMVLAIAVDDVAERLVLSVSGPVVEGQIAQLILSRNTSVARPLAVVLSSSHPALLNLVSETEIPAGTWQTTVDITAVDNLRDEPDYVAMLVAQPADAPTARLSFSVMDNDPSVPKKADLTGAGFDIVNDHLLSGVAMIELAIHNSGTVPAGAFEVLVLWSLNDTIGDADDVVLPEATLAFDGLNSGGTVTASRQVQLDVSTLYARALSQAAAGQAVGTVSAEAGLLYMLIDWQNSVSETSETNNFNTGHLIDSDDYTFFPWDSNGDGFIQPVEALGAIQAIGKPSALYDFNGDGVVSPLEALSAIQRIAYERNNAVIEPSGTVFPDGLPSSAGSAVS
ncbi:MAG: Ig-like domain-containing protein [Planctomycetaceae bacterium]